MNGTFVTLAGFAPRVHYYSAGVAGTPVILLHGGGVDSALLSWKLTLPVLSRTHRVFAPEMPGYGLSDRPDGFEHTIESYGRIICAFIDALGIERTHAVGVSMGGAMTLHLALTYPERMLKLVPVASYGLQRTAPTHLLSYAFVQMTFLSRATYALLRNNRSWTRASVSPIFADPANLTDDLADDVYQEMCRLKAGDAFMAFQHHEMLARRMRTNYMDRLHEIRAQTLFIHGEEDALVPVAAAREAVRKLPGSKLHVMHNCGHWPQRERPDEFNAVITKFLHDQD